MSAGFRIGIDLGGSKIEGAAIDATGVTRIRRRIATPIHDYRGTIEAIAGLTQAIEQEIGMTASVGVGIPGAVDAWSRLWAVRGSPVNPGAAWPSS